MQMQKAAYAVLLLCGCLLFMADDCDNTTDAKVANQQEVIQQQAMAQTGMPGITNFTELKLVRHLYELRDSKIATFAYVPDMQGRLWHLCDSIGYGLPYGVQFSNPEKWVTQGEGSYHTMPQAEPNGLFMPATAEGTWVMCANPTKEGGIDPVYVEPRVIVSPFKLKTEGEYEVR